MSLSFSNLFCTVYSILSMLHLKLMISFFLFVNVTHTYTHIHLYVYDSGGRLNTVLDNQPSLSLGKPFSYSQHSLYSLVPKILSMGDGP